MHTSHNTPQQVSINSLGEKVKKKKDWLVNCLNAHPKQKKQTSNAIASRVVQQRLERRVFEQALV